MLAWAPRDLGAPGLPVREVSRGRPPARRACAPLASGPPRLRRRRRHGPVRSRPRRPARAQRRGRPGRARSRHRAPAGRPRRWRRRRRPSPCSPRSPRPTPRRCARCSRPGSPRWAPRCCSGRARTSSGGPTAACGWPDERHRRLGGAASGAADAIISAWPSAGSPSAGPIATRRHRRPRDAAGAGARAPARAEPPAGPGAGDRDVHGLPDRPARRARPLARRRGRAAQRRRPGVRRRAPLAADGTEALGVRTVHVIAHTDCAAHGGDAEAAANEAAAGADRIGAVLPALQARSGLLDLGTGVVS